MLESFAETLARGLWLVESRLLDRRVQGAEMAGAIRLLLAERYRVDDATAARVARRLYGDAKEPDFLSMVDDLCGALFEMRQGLPVFPPDFRLRRLARMLDPDALACLHPGLNLPAEEHYDWAAIPIAAGDRSNGVLDVGSVESHIHLGGVLPPVFYWIGIMSGDIPLDVLDFHVTEQTRRPEEKQEWREAIGLAMWLRLRLAARLQVAEGAFAHLPKIDAVGEAETQAGNSSKTDALSMWMALLEGSAPPPLARVRGCALALSRPQRLGVAPQQRCCPLVDPLRYDPGRGTECHYAQGERRLLVLSMRRLRALRQAVAAAGPTAEIRCQAQEWEQDLLAYLRLRNAFHEKLVHDHGVDGLLRFVENFDRRGFFQGRRKNRRRRSLAQALAEQRAKQRREEERQCTKQGRKEEAPRWQPPETSPPTVPAKTPMVRFKLVRSVRARLPLRRNKRRRAMRLLERARMAVALDAQLRDAFNDPAPPHGPADSSRAMAYAAHAPIRRIEMRVSVPGNNQMLRTIRAWLEGLAEHLHHGDLGIRNSQVGLVFHFIKFANPAKAGYSAERQARQLCGVLKGYPGLRRYIVGVDAAGNERLVPPRVFAGAFACVRGCLEQVRSRHDDPRVHIGWTYHAGEDADDLLTALRHMHEAVFLLFPESLGGRLGHALLLGDKPEVFYARRRLEVEVGLASHLLDLVWLQGFLAEQGKVDWQPWLRQRIAALLEQYLPAPAGREGLSRQQSTEQAISRCYEAMLLGADGKAAACSEAVLLKEHLGLDAVPQRFVHLRADERWLQMLDFAQERLQKAFCRRRVCIEANPTSNLLIGGYSAYEELPYRRLVEAGLPLSLNTDDPGLFVSSLPGEFSAMYGALAAAGMEHRQILRWLDERIGDARHASFLSPQVPIGSASPVLEPAEMNALFRYQPGG